MTLLKKQALQDIEHLLQERGEKTSDFGLPPVVMHSAEIMAQQDYFLPLQDLLHSKNNAMVSNFSPEQLHIYNILFNAIYNNTGRSSKLFFLTGQAGHGKTHVSEALIHYSCSCGELPFVVGATALSASNYDCASTAHSGFLIPVVKDHSDIVSGLHHGLKCADLIFFDH